MRRGPFGVALVLVGDDAFECARASFVEFEPARKRLEAHRQIFHLDAEPGRLDHEVVRHLEVQAITLGVHRVQLRLDVKRVNQRIRVEQQLENRTQQSPNPANRGPVGLKQRFLFERVVGP